MASLLQKIFGTFDLESSKDIKSQIESNAGEDFVQAPVRALEAPATSKDSIQVSDEVEFNKVIADHVDDYDVEREFELLTKLDTLQSSINKTLVEKGLIKNPQDYASALDVLSEDLYSTDNNASNSLWGQISKEHNLPNIRTVTAAVHPDIYHTFAGDKNAKFGGMADAHLYPDEFLARWAKSGNIYEYPKQAGGHVTRELMYGKEIGQKVTAGINQAYINTNKVITGKFGGKLSGSLYALFAIGILLQRWEYTNWREEQRQRLKYGLRLLDSEAPVTDAQRDIAEVHKKWLQTYYEEEEEEEEEENEEDEE